MSQPKKPKQWEDVYPQGCKEGDEEQKFFIALARNKKFDWRSIAALAKESNLSKVRVEEIIAKYYKKGMIFQNPKSEEQWAYWKRVPHMLPPDPNSVSNEDKKNRIDKAIN